MSDFARLIEKLRALHAEGHLNSEASINLMIEHGSRIFRTGNMDDAETVFGDCVSRSVKHFGTVHEASMQAMTKLCEIYSANKRHDEANRIYQLYLRLLHSELTTEYADDLNKVQEVVEMWKKYAHEKDVNHFSEFLHVLQINSASADPRLAINASLNHTLSKIPSTSLEEAHKIEEALKLCLQRAVERLGEDDEETITVRLHLAAFLDEKMLRIADAETLYVQIIVQLTAKDVAPGEVNCLLLDVKVRYSRMLLIIGRAEQSFKMLQEVLAEKSESASKRLHLLHRQARLLLAKGYADAGQHSDAIAVLEDVNIDELSDNLDDLRDLFVYHYVKDGQLPGPASSERLSVYEELHRCFRGKLGPDLANMAGNKWTASRIYALSTYAKLCTLVPAHAADAIPLFEALVRNAVRVFGREHPFTLDISINEMEFHMYRLSVQDIYGYSDVARDIQQTIEKLRAKFGVDSAALSRSHEFQQKRAEFYLLMTDQTMNANGPATALNMIWYWKEKMGPESFETKRVTLFREFLTISATSPLEGESALKITSPDPHANAYLSVMSRKFLLRLVLRRIDACRFVPNMQVSIFEELKGLYRVAVTLLRSLFGASAKQTRDVIEDAKKIFEKYDDNDMIDALDEELLEALRMEHAELSDEKFSALSEVRELKAKIAANYEPARIAKLYQAAEGYRPQRNFVRAEPLYRTVIRRRTKALGADAYETLVARNSYSVMLWNMQRYAEAQYHLEEILQLRTRTSGETDSFTLRIEFNLSNIYKYQGYMNKAETLYRHCLVGRRATLGDRQKETLNTLFYLAGVIASQHRYREAYTLYEECKTLRTAAFGATNGSVKEVETAVSVFVTPGTVDMLCRNAQNAMGDKHHDYAAAAELLTEALFLQETVLRTNGNDICDNKYAEIVVQCARARRMAGSWSALTMLTETFQTLRSRSSTLSHVVMQVAQELAHLQLLLRRRDGGAAPALEVYQPLLESARNSGSDQGTMVRLHIDLATVLFDTCNFAEAETHYRAAWSLLSESSGLAGSIASTMSSQGSGSSLYQTQNVESQLALALSAVGNRDALFQQAVKLRRAHRTKESDWCIAGEEDLVGRMLLECPVSSLTILPYRTAWVMPSQSPSTAERYQPSMFAQPAETFSKDTTSLIKFSRPILNTGPGSKEFEHPTLLGIANISERASRLATQATGKPFEFAPPSWSSPTTTSSSSSSSSSSNRSGASSSANAFVYAPPPTIVQNNNPPPPPQSSFGGFGNPSGSSSLFGNSNSNNNNSNNNSGGGLFGNSGSSGGGLFGSGSSNNNNNNSGGGGLFSRPANSGGMFGNGGASAPSGGGLFSNLSSSRPSGGLFGNSGSAPSSAPSGGGLFSSSNNSSGGSGLFGATPSSGGGLFSAGNNSSGSFGSTAPTGTLFGNGPPRPFGAPAAPSGFGAPQPSGSLFGANPTGSSNPSFSFGNSQPAPTIPDPNSTTATAPAGSGTRVDPRRITRSSHRRR